VMYREEVRGSIKTRTMFRRLESYYACHRVCKSGGIARMMRSYASSREEMVPERYVDGNQAAVL
jgi:hypothetical protein